MTERPPLDNETVLRVQEGGSVRFMADPCARRIAELRQKMNSAGLGSVSGASSFKQIGGNAPAGIRRESSSFRRPRRDSGEPRRQRRDSTGRRMSNLGAERHASMEGSPSLVEQISAIPQPGSPAAFDPSEFHDAVYEGDIDLVEEMIASGVPCDVVDGDGNTALLLAAEGEPLIVDALIKAGCNVNHQNEEGATALMSAVRYEDHDIVDALIKAGADPEIMDKHGQKAADMVTSADVAKALGIAQEDSEAKAPAAPNDTGRRASVSQRGNGIGRRAVANVAMDVAGLFIAISDGDADEVETPLAVSTSSRATTT